ncbi:MAG: hypothetical protein H6564_18515 [Lewinellaceae bacterium]|nr:hypothetical protein [Lewinellaceae bacterium]
MAQSTQRLNVAALFAERDEGARHEFMAYLTLLEHSRPWLSLSYYTAGHLNEFEFNKLLDNTDVFLFAASTDFLADCLKQQAQFRLAMDYHRLGRLKAVSLLMRACSLRESIFSQCIILPANGEPASSPAWRTRDDAYLAIQAALADILDSALAHKRKLEKRWQEAQASNSVQAYWAFLREYPRCRYAREAQRLRNELDEKELWSRAEKEDTAPGYYYYLSHAPLLLNRLEAALRISRIEDDEEANWREADGNKTLELFFRYRAAFPGGKYQEEARQAIIGMLAGNVKLEGYYPAGMSSNYLTHQAHGQLKRMELFALNAYLPYCWSLRGNLEKLIQKIAFRQLLYPVYSFLLLMLIILILPFAKGRFTEEGMRLSVALQYVFLLIVGFMMARQAWRSHFHLRYDIQTLNDTLLALKRGTVLLKAAYLANDSRHVREILVMLTRVERVMEDVTGKNFLHYLINTQPLEPLAPEGQRAVA